MAVQTAFYGSNITQTFVRSQAICCIYFEDITQHLVDKLGEIMLKKTQKEQRYALPQLSEASGVPARTIQYWETNGVEHGTVGNVRNVAV